MALREGMAAELGDEAVPPEALHEVSAETTTQRSGLDWQRLA
jgi:hypothetical protein